MRIVPDYASRARMSKLFEPAMPALDPEGLVSKYVEFELHRLRQRDVDPGGTLQHRLRLLNWYTNVYARIRLDNMVRVPLSAAQIRFLNAPIPLGGASPAATIGLQNAVASDVPHLSDLRDLNQLASALYWWAIEYLPVHLMDDRLITPDQIALLRSECQWQGDPFALTVFMREYFNRHSELHYLDMANSRDRAAFVNYLVLLSFSQPVIARLLPRDHVKRVLKETAAGTCFHKVVGSYVFADPDADAARVLIDQGQESLKAYGFSYKSGWSQPRVRNGDTGDCYGATLALDRPIEDGVALIGPIASTSGLGQATRLSLGALMACEDRAPTVIPFKLDNPAPIGFASDTKVALYDNRRAINLIHLNAESIPLAFAYMQSEIFETSYNIGYFFWELNKLPKCHNLALEMLDEIWVSSEYNREIYAARTDIPVVNVGMAVENLPSVAPMDRATLGLPADAIVFLTTFDSFSFIERKNPLAVVGAFREAFPNGDENVRLVLKTQNRTRVHDPYQVRVWSKIDQELARDERIIVIDETYKYRDLLSLKVACDCYVSLHRSEGWGFGMIEAMQLGSPVICTAYSGNMDFCSEQTAYLVNYELLAPIEEEYIFVERGSLWADPDVTEAARHMRAVANDPEAAKRKGRDAKAFIEKNFSVEAIGKRYGARLAAIRAKAFPSA